MFSYILPAMLTICVEHKNNYATLMTMHVHIINIFNASFACCSIAESIGSFNTTEQDLENKYAEIGKQ